MDIFFVNNIQIVERISIKILISYKYFPNEKNQYIYIYIYIYKNLYISYLAQLKSNMIEKEHFYKINLSRNDGIKKQFSIGLPKTSEEIKKTAIILSKLTIESEPLSCFLRHTFDKKFEHIYIIQF